MPVRRKERRKRVKNRLHKSFNRKKFYFFILIGVVIFGILLILHEKTHFWDGENKLSVVTQDRDNLNVLVFDPSVNEIITLTIPGNTEVNVARNLGRWKVKSLWKLSKNENLEGTLVAETVTRSLLLPTYSWSRQSFINFSGGKLSAMFSSLISTKDTNLGVGDKLSIMLFSLKIPNKNRRKYDLSETSYLKATTLNDGEEGFVVTELMPETISSIFADPVVSNKQIKVSIVNESGSQTLPTSLASLIDILGGKVAVIKNDEVSDTDCVIFGKDIQIDTKFSRLLGCTVSEKSNNLFDVEIVIGKKFEERY